MDPAASEPGRLPAREALARATVEVLQRGGARNPDVLLVETSVGRVVVKDFAPRGPLVRRLLGPWIHRRESRAYARLEGCESVPRFLGWLDPLAIAVEYRPGRYLSRRLRERGLRVAVVRHPMPYGDLERQAVQRFATRADLDAAGCTIEEREEYEPHLALGSVVHAGIDTRRVLDAAAEGADLILWDGGNNDFPFVHPDLHVVLADALRPGQEATHHPGEAVLRMADVAVIAKCDAAPRADVTRVEAAVRRINPRARRVRGASPVTLDDAAAVRGRRVIVVEDGPTTTHGGMAHGAGYAAALAAGAEIVDPRASAAPAIAALYAEYPQLGPVLPAMGYSAPERAALAATIEASRAELVISGTPHDLASVLGIAKPVLRARYEFAEIEAPGLWGEVEAFLKRAPGAR